MAKSKAPVVLMGTTAAAAIACLLCWQRSQARRAQVLASRFTGAYRKEAYTMILLALKCGDAIRRCDEGRGASAHWKDIDGIDPVTKTDQENEALVVEGLAAAFPDHAVIGEEAAAAAGAIPPLSSKTNTFIVDPIDGTQNFVHGAPLSAVSIGLCRRGEPVLGIVYDPHRDELFAGAHGEGAFMNGERIFCDSSVESLTGALLVTDVGYERSFEGIEKMLSGYRRLLECRCQSFRIIGSTVLSIIWVACGRANAFAIGFNNEGGKPWDYAAAYVIAKEAGALFSRLDNRSYGDVSSSGSSAGTTPFDIYSRSCVCAGSSQLTKELLGALQTV